MHCRWLLTPQWLTFNRLCHFNACIAYRSAPRHEIVTLPQTAVDAAVADIQKSIDEAPEGGDTPK
jgi:hypothetical protein